MEISCVTLMAGRFYALEAYFWGLSIIDYPKDQIHLLFLTNSDNDDFIHLMDRRIENLKGYASIRFIKTDIVKPSSNAFIEKGIYTNQHAETIATLYNEAYKHIETDNFLTLEDDIIAPANAITGLLPLQIDGVAIVCGVVRCRHNEGIFIWDLGYKKVFGEADSCQEKSYYGIEIRKPWGVREIGLGPLALTLLKKSLCARLSKPIFKPYSNLPGMGSLPGCDMVLYSEFDSLGYKRLCNFDVRACHMSSDGRIH